MLEGTLLLEPIKGTRGMIEPSYRTVLVALPIDPWNPWPRLEVSFHARPGIPTLHTGINTGITGIPFPKCDVAIAITW